MATHYVATGTRTLCGRVLSPRMSTAPLWPAFLYVYKENRAECCEKCVKACKGWQRFSRDLAIVDRERRAAAPGSG